MKVALPWLLAVSMIAATTRGAAAQTSPAGNIPTGLPSHLVVGLTNGAGDTWMKTSGVPWDSRYQYLTKGWSNNWGWGQRDGWYALNYMQESASYGLIPTLTFYQMNDEPGGGEAQFAAKLQNAGTMNDYFTDVKILMQRAKDFGKPVIIHVEPDGFGFLEQQTSDNPNAYAAIAASGVAELAGLPNTVAGWGLAFLQLRKAVGASNVILAVHVSSWASGVEFATHSVTDPLQPIVTKVNAFLQPMGLGANQTGATYDLLAGDPLDRDADYYRLTQGSNPWWDASDAASISSASFNRYAEWLRLWNQTAGKRWMLWQIPVGNSNHSNVYNNGNSREGYKDNRAEYFFGGGKAHAQKFADAGVVALLFGGGAAGMSGYTNDTYTDGQLFLKSRVGSFYSSGGLALSGGSGTTTPPPAPTFTSAATANPTAAAPGATVAITVSLTDTGAALTNGVVNLEVHDASNATVAQQSWTAQSFAAAGTKSLTYSWTAPATTGAYTFAVGVYGANATPQYHWNAGAGGITIATVASDPAQYSFEAGAQGWASSGGMISAVAATTAQHYAGTKALQLSFTGTSGQTQAVKVANTQSLKGKTVSFKIFIPAGSKVSWIQPYVLQGASGNWAWTGNYQPMSALKAGAWNVVTVQVPANAAALAEVGVQFATSAAWTGKAYVDAVSW